MFEQNIDIKEFNSKLLENVLYKSNIENNKLTLDLGDISEKN